MRLRCLGTPTTPPATRVIAGARQLGRLKHLLESRLRNETSLIVEELLAGWKELAGRR